MKQNISHIALVVNDYEEAIKSYTEKLNFTLIERYRSKRNKTPGFSRTKRL